MAVDEDPVVHPGSKLSEPVTQRLVAVNSDDGSEIGPVEAGRVCLLRIFRFTWIARTGEGGKVVFKITAPKSWKAGTLVPPRTAILGRRTRAHQSAPSAKGDPGS